MGLDMYMVRKRKQNRGKLKIYEWETPMSRNFYKDGVIIHTAYWNDKEKAFDLKKAPKRKQYDYYIDNLETAYWRKANQIHKWFVDNVQQGKDDCGDYKVEYRHLSELLGIVTAILDKVKLVEGMVNNGYSYKKNIFGKLKKVYNKEKGLVIDNKKYCKKMLPTADGFFFGSTEYDEYYYRDLEYTKEVLTKILENYDFDKETLIYHSSW